MTTLETYDAKLGEAKAMFDEFLAEAAKGKEGHGSKIHALKARKLSTKLSFVLKDFRAASIDNDKAKPVKKREKAPADPAVQPQQPA